MKDIGQKLRDARITAGMSLQDIADYTRIRVSYLEAMEEGQFEKLPGPVYVKGFIKQYAQFVGLDGNELIEMYRRESQEEPPQAVAKVATGPSEEPRKRMDRHRRKASHVNPRKIAIIAFILLIIGGGVYFTYFMFTTLKNETIPQLREPEIVDQTEDPSSNVADPSTDNPDAIGNDSTDGAMDGTGEDGFDSSQQSMDPLTTDPAVSDAVDPDAAGQTPADQSRTGQVVNPATTTGQPGTATQPSGTTGQTTTPGTTTPAPGVTPPASGTTTPQGATTAPTADTSTDQGTTTQIQVVVTGTSWLKVDVDGVNKLTRTVENETLTYVGQTFKIKAGNGGAVQVIQNGVLSEPFGKPGSVVTREFGQQQ